MGNEGSASVFGKDPRITWNHHRGWSDLQITHQGHLITAQVSASMVEGLTWTVESDGKRVAGGNDESGGSAYSRAEAAVAGLLVQK